MFNNASVYLLPKNWGITSHELEEYIQPQAFTPCTNLELQTQGWVSPVGNENLVHTVNRQFLLQLNTEKKLLPASVINQVAKIRAAELTEQQGFPPGKKKFKEIKEEVVDELLPRAFSITRSTKVWIDPINGWLVIDAGSPQKAEEILTLLLKAIPKFPLENYLTVMSPQGAMTTWLATDEAPQHFTVDQDTELRATGEGKATIRYVRHALEADDIRRHVDSGKKCTRLAMTWADKISFVLTENLSIKRITPLDILKEDADATLHHKDEKFDADFALMTSELNAMLNALTDALGGKIVKKNQ